MSKKDEEFRDVLEGIKEDNTLNSKISLLIKLLEKMSNNVDKAEAFRELLIAMRQGDLLKRYFSKALSLAEDIRYDDDYFRTFADLLDVIHNTELLKNNFQVILNTVENMENDYDRIYAFAEVLRVIHGSELMNNFYLRIETICAKVVDTLEKIDFPFQMHTGGVIYYYRERACKVLLEVIKGSRLEEKFGSRIERICMVKLHLKYQEFKKKLPFTTSQIYEAYIFNNEENCIHEFNQYEDDVFFDDAGSEMYLSGKMLMNFFIQHLSDGHYIEVYLDSNKLVGLHPNHFPFLYD